MQHPVLHFKCITMQFVLISLFLMFFVFLAFSSASPFHHSAHLSHQSLFLSIGAVISAISCILVIVCYCCRREYRRHPNTLLFWKSIADLAFAFRSIIQFNRHLTYAQCNTLGAISQFFALSSELWFFFISLDLWFCTNNPFMNLKTNVQMYHLLAWGFAATSAVIYYIIPSRSPPQQIDFCWFTDNDVPAAWGLYYGWVIIFVICAAIILFLEHKSCLTGGLKETVKAREMMIRSSRITTITYCIYQASVVGLWVTDVSLGNQSYGLAGAVERFSALFSGSKGLIDLIVWVAINGLPQCSWRLPTTEEDVVSDVDIDLQPQLNIALRREVLHFTTRGVIAAAKHAESAKRSRRLTKIRIHELGMSIRFYDYEPATFREIRRGFDISCEAYTAAFSRTCHERIQSGGSSGAFMFYTANYQFIVKTVTNDERNTLLSMLPDYLQHMQLHPDSYMTRFFGCHSISMYGQEFLFLVMSNVIGQFSMHNFYDIKGSWVDRNAKVIEPGKTVVCTYCSQAFKSGSQQRCEYSVHGRHMPRIVLKDNDFRKKIRLEDDKARDLVNAISADCDFLCSQGIMDYSLLLSVHNTRYQVGDDFRMTQAPSKRRINRAAQSPDAGRNLDRRETIMVSPDDHHRMLRDSSRRSSDGGGFSRSCRYSVIRNEEETPTSESTPLLPRQQFTTAEEFGWNDWVGRRKPIKEGIPVHEVVGPDYYTFGIIDILQTWTLAKRFERIWKVHCRCLDRNGISAVPPVEYADRFKRKIEDMVMLGSHSDAAYYHH